MKKSFLLGLAAMLLPLTVWAQGDAKVISVTAANVDYDGDATKSGITVKVGDVTLTEGTDYQVVYTRNNERVQKVRDAGNYTAIISMLSSSSYWDYTLPVDAPQSGYTFTVNKYKVNGGVTLNKGVAVEYTGDIISGTEKTTDGKNLLEALVGDLSGVLKADTDAERANFLAGLKLVGFENAQIGPNVNKNGYGVQVADNGNQDWSSNYEYTTASEGSYVALHIAPKELTLTQTQERNYNEVTVQLEYAANFFTLDGIIDADKGEVEIDELTYEGEGNLTDADTYTLTATLKGDAAGNYTVKENENGGHVDFVIGKATLTMADAEDQDLTKTYGDDDPEDFYDQFTFTPSYSENQTPLTKEKVINIVTITRGEDEDVIPGEKAGEYGGYDLTVALTEEGAKNFELEGYDESKKPQFVIEPKAIGDEFGNAKEGFALAVEDEKIVYNAKAYEGFHEEEGDPIKDLVTVTYTEDDEDETLEEGKDYYIYISATEAGKSTDAGSALTLGVFGKGNYTGSIFKQNLTIAKAELTITPKENAVLSKVEDGKDSGNIADQFDFVGLKEGQDEESGIWNTEGVLTMRSSVKTAGEKGQVELRQPDGKRIQNSDYLSKDPATGLKNYIVHYDKVDFTILANNLVLDGSIEDDEIVEALEQYNGLKVPTVTVKNLKSLLNSGFSAGNKWYTLVLPFEVTVRDLSNAFGYAIVNVPNTTNNDPNKTVMSLTMGTVPANTMIAFKVDNSLNSDEDINLEEGVTFSEKTIVAPDGAWAEDLAGNKFIGVYEPTLIDQANQFYLYPAEGKFYPGSGWSGGMLINALNGYVEFNANADLSKVSIVLEEADGSTTAINAITGDVINSNAEGWYTVGGMKLDKEPTQKGVYINNGKKVVIK